MPYSTAAKNLMLQALADADGWVTLHTATSLAAGAAAGQNQIAVVHLVEVGATVKVDRDGVNEETHSVVGVSGAGPYTLTLAAELANTHDVDVYVSYDPHTVIGPKEPTGGEPTFARQPISWGAPSDGNLDSSSQPELDVVGGTPLTHAVIMDAEDGTGVLAWGEIPFTIHPSQAKFRLRDADLHLNL